MKVLKNIILFGSVLLWNIACGQKSFSEIVQSNRGSTQTYHEFTKTFEDVDGNKSAMPIAVIKGVEDGPVITLIAGIHGYEYPPIIAAQELIQEIKSKTIRGTIIIIPMANPNAFYKRTPFLNPQDELNLNRVFPGDASGSITEKLAAFMTNEVIENSDIFIDIHGGDANEDLLPFVCYYNNPSKLDQTKQAQELSEHSGFDYVVAYNYNISDNEPAKYAFKQAVQDGKVALSIECGKLGNLQQEAVDLIKAGAYNVLQTANALSGEKPKAGDFTTIENQVYIKSEYQGIFESDLKSGDAVEEGQVIGLIRNEFGDLITEIKATKSGIILYKIGTPPVNIGETIVCIGF